MSPTGKRRLSTLCPQKMDPVGSDQGRKSVNHQPGESADDRAVDADELQVATNVEFDAFGRLFAIPPIDSLGDDRRHFAAIVVDHVGRKIRQHRIETQTQRFIGQEPLAKRNQFLDRPPA